MAKTRSEITPNLMRSSTSLGVYAFVSKLSATGNQLIYSNILGSGYGLGIAVDSKQEAFVTGSTNSNDFPTTSDAYQKTLNPKNYQNYSAFISKLNVAGSGLIYSSYLGGSGGSRGSGIAVDSYGNAYVTGSTYSYDFPTTSGAYQPKLSPSNRSTFPVSNAFITKFNPTGKIVYSTYLGGTSTAPQ